MARFNQQNCKFGCAHRSCIGLLHGLPEKLVCVVGYSLVLFVCLGGPAHSQPISTCKSDSLRELHKAIEMHNDNIYRLNKKFKDIWYHQGPVPEEVRKAIGLKDIKEYLVELGQRKTAVLFHGVKGDYLRSWLITYRGKITCSSPRILTQEDWNALQPNSWSVLGVRGVKNPRTATPLYNGQQVIEDQAQRWDAILQRLSDILLPHEVQRELELSNIDTLVVVPITVREFNRSVDTEETSATYVEKERSALDVPSARAALSIGVVPFAALPIGGDVLINRLSVVIAPGFFSFARAPQTTGREYVDAIVVGNPQRQGFQTLPGAEEEAKYVATILKSDHLLEREAATKAALESYLRQNASSVDFIHLATHGVADSKDPVDESFLVFSDGLWNARGISNLKRKVQIKKNGKQTEEEGPLLQAKPLVVMSACQTALGKDFPAGTIGLARAWYWAGASNIVMSLWSVDDEATKELMELFVGFVVDGQAVDKALQSAMVRLRGKYPSPSYWASFSVYGPPQRLESNSP